MSKDKHLHCPSPMAHSKNSAGASTVVPPTATTVVTTATAAAAATATATAGSGSNDGVDIINDMGEAWEGVDASGMGEPKGAILIDDRESAREAWEAAGGQVTPPPPRNTHPHNTPPHNISLITHTLKNTHPLIPYPLIIHTQ